MSVYTRLNINELSPVVTRLKLDPIKSLEGISAGVVNTNYKLTTDSQKYVLTLVEDPQEAVALPFIAGLLTHLAKKGIPCPHPVADTKGKAYFSIKNRPSLLAGFLNGSSPTEPTKTHCYEIGKILATIHIAGADFPQVRQNPMGAEKWAELLNKIGPMLQTKDSTTMEILLNELQWLEDNFQNPELPKGVCHGDLFPDNSLFVEEKLTGVIDFFFACNDLYIYDLAVARNAWCFDVKGKPIPGYWEKLLDGYEKIRPLTKKEKKHLTTTARAAALRFSLTRLHDNFFPRSGETVTKKDPQPFLERLKYFRQL
ncbi:MAG: homoserine kinase [Magnetococcales bacterium]|nr:homoserine kinase [Magnetococcales bacterium]